MRRDNDLVDRETRGLEHAAPHLGLNRVRGYRPAGLDDHDRSVWVSRRGHRERGDTARTDTRHAVHDPLDVLRKIVTAADDDQLLLRHGRDPRERG